MNPFRPEAACALPLPRAKRLTSFRDRLGEEGLLRDICLDGHRYSLVDVGEGPALVLLHGLGGSLYDWRHLLRPLSRKHRVLIVDLLGSGESDIPEDGDYGLAAQARRIRGLLDLLGVERASLVGNSYGGGIALQLAQDWPNRVPRMVLINSVCYPEQIPAYVTLARAPWARCVAETLPLGSLTRWALRHSYRTVERLSDEELDTYVQELRRPGRRRAVVQILRAILPPDTREFEARLPTLRLPVLLLWGTSDRTIPVSLGRRLVKDLPDARLLELDAGHVPHQECPELVLPLIQGFLEEG